MLSRFFSTSQPVHYLVGILLLGPFSLLAIWLLKGNWEWGYLIVCLILPLALLLVQFIILKNELTEQNSYGLFAYTMLTLTVLAIGFDWKFTLCLLLLLLAMRRLLSLKTGTATIRKIFDGAFWISIAALVMPAMSIFMMVVFTSVFLFDRTKWRHWAVPFVAMICVTVLAFTLETLLESPIISRVFLENEYALTGMLQQWQSNQMAAWIMAVLAAIGFVVYIIKLVDIQQRVRPRFSVLTVWGICALALALGFNSDYLLLLVPVLAIFQVRAVEHVRHKGFREFIFLMPAFLLVLALFMRY